MNILKVFESYL